VINATATAAVIDNQNFQNNLFTDFAPLLALFGDDITKQFLYTSMRWSDDILLGIAQIRMSTIMVRSIRIGENNF
jgi:hypothetical protein